MIRAREVATQDTREANAFLTAALDRGVCSRRETAVFALLATLMGFSIYGLHVLNGGFILDDWAYAAEYEIHGRDLGFLGFADRLLNDPDVLLSAGGRPVGALYFAGTYSAFGSNMALHIACSVVLSIAVSTLLFVVLRTLGLERVHAGVIAALVLVFPASDSIRFLARRRNEPCRALVLSRGPGRRPRGSAYGGKTCRRPPRLRRVALHSEPTPV